MTCRNALTNTLRIAEMCDLKLDFNTSKNIQPTTALREVARTYLRELCSAGLREALRGASRQ